MVIKLEQIYNKLLNDNGIEKDISNIDSLGINVSEYQNDFPFELKVYYQPEEDIEKKENDPELIQFVFDKKMVKYRCVVKGTELQRNYVVLDNQTYLNMKGFSEKIKKIFPHLQEDIGKIPALIPEKEKKYLPIHILGVKNNNKYGTAINMEWLLRDYLDDENLLYGIFDTFSCPKNKDIEDVLLPYGQKINKYDFISLASQILPFGNCSFISMHSIFENTFMTDQSYDTKMTKICNTVRKQLDEWIYNYDTISDILIKMSIILENIYLSKETETIAYKTTSYNIEHVLSIFETRSEVKGIIEHGYTEQGKYDFELSVTNIVNNFQKSYMDHHSTSADLKETIKRLKAILTLEKEPQIVYFEILLLVANTYNTYIKELYCNEW